MKRSGNVLADAPQHAAGIGHWEIAKAPGLIRWRFRYSEIARRNESLDLDSR
jgi:hypothetical protein